MQYLVWDTDPILLNLGAVQIRWYGLMFASAFMSSYYFMSWIYKREGKNVDELDRMLWYLAIGTVLGARIVHCLFYDPEYYLANPIRILAIWEGGLASHGALLGIVVSLYLYRIKTRDSFLWLADRIALSCILGASMIRIGNFFNSEILGHVTDVPWAIIFSRVDSLPRHPVQLYESFSYALIFFVLLLAYRKTAHTEMKALILGLDITLIFFARFWLEFFKVRQASYSLDLTLNTGQLLSIPFFLMGVFLIFWALRQYAKHSAK